MCGSDPEPPADEYRTQAHLRPRLERLGEQLGAAVGAPGAQPVAAGELVIEPFPVTYEGHTYPHARIAYVRGRPPAPAVLVHPNYAGLKQFDIDQAAYLAKVGYVGVACDLYKDIPSYTYADRNPLRPGKPGAGSKENRQSLMKHGKGAFDAMNGLLRTPKYWRGLMKAYLDQAWAHPAVQDGLAGAIGYCFGGQCLLEQVRAGHGLQAVVSFHGLLHSRPTRLDDAYNSKRRLTVDEWRKECDPAPNSYAARCKVLIENGDLDDEPSLDAEGIAIWKKEMDDAKIDWRFNNHARTPHGFALAPGVISTQYTEAADRRSTLSMLSLFAEAWPAYPQYPVAVNASGTVLGQHIIPSAKL